MTWLLVILALGGHVAIGTAVLNRIHSTALPHALVKCIDLLWVAWHGALPLLWCVAAAVPDLLGESVRVLLLWHQYFCVAGLFLWIPHIQQHRSGRRAQQERSCETTVVDMVDQLGHVPVKGMLAKTMVRIPGNEILQLHVTEKRLQLPQLTDTLEGLSIAHVSDLHFTGALNSAFHHEIVRQVNQLDADIIALTGDIIDKPQCRPWLGEVLGQLRAPHGCYFVLGNHDYRLHDEFGVRGALTDQGLIDLGRRSLVVEIRGEQVLLAGNELPWFRPAANLREHPATGEHLRVLLAHSPDQFPWAQRHDIDLMLAGHTHGGQVQFPLVGPILSPSRFGTRYASGTFFTEPTLMHVSRGVSGTRHFRYHAAPEISKLVLTRAADS